MNLKTHTVDGLPVVASTVTGVGVCSFCSALCEHTVTRYVSGAVVNDYDCEHVAPTPSVRRGVGPDDVRRGAEAALRVWHGASVLMWSAEDLEDMSLAVGSVPLSVALTEERVDWALDMWFHCVSWRSDRPFAVGDVVGEYRSTMRRALVAARAAIGGRCLPADVVSVPAGRSCARCGACFEGSYGESARLAIAHVS